MLLRLILLLLVSGSARRLRSHPASLWALFVAAVALSAVGALGFFDAFVAHPDAQGGLALVVLPFYQLLGVLAFLAFARLLAKRAGAR
jgi:uncharacterized membrane protein